MGRPWSAVLAAALVLLTVLPSSSEAAGAPGPEGADVSVATPQPAQVEGVIVAVGRAAAQPLGPGRSQLTLRPEGGVRETVLTAPRIEDQARLASAQAGDRVWIVADDVVAPREILAVNRVARPVLARDRIVALALALTGLIAFAAAVTFGGPQRFLIGSDNRYSNSQCQLALWFGAVAVVYAAACGLRIWELGLGFAGGVNLPINLLTLTGLSALTFGGAKLVISQKQGSATGSGSTAGTLPATPAAPAPLTTTASSAVSAMAPTATPPAPTVPSAAAHKTQAPSARLRDLVTNDAGTADLGDFQMIVVTLAAVGIFLAAAFHFLGALDLAASTTLPDVDTTLVGVFGLGQGAYLVKKAALPLGQG